MRRERWLILRLEAPLIAFGGVVVDQIGVTRDFPAASMLTGLIANALGWGRAERLSNQRLQERLIFAARREREIRAGVLTDTQNANLEKDKGWTTYGVPEERAGATYDAPHRRRREYHTDACVTVALRLLDTGERPNLDDLAQALDRPARPLFFGRKPCLPAGRILQATVEAESAYNALALAPLAGEARAALRALWPWGEGPNDGEGVDRIYDIADLRNWKTGLHGGVRRIVEGRVWPVGGTE